MPSRKKIYSALTIISTILGLPGLVIQVYAFIEERAEEARKSEAAILRERIDYAQSIVPNCYFAISEFSSMNVSSVLDRAEKRTHTK
jgi:hypothetical protein